MRTDDDNDLNYDDNDDGTQMLVERQMVQKLKPEEDREHVQYQDISILNQQKHLKVMQNGF